MKKITIEEIQNGETVNTTILHDDNNNTEVSVFIFPKDAPEDIDQLKNNYKQSLLDTLDKLYKVKLI